MTDQVRGEGWAWVDTVPSLTPAELYGFARTRRDRRAPNKTEAKRIAKLQARQQAIDDQLNAEEAEDIAEKEAQALYAESDRIGAELDAIHESLLTYPAETLPLAGAIVTVDHTGAITVHRGLLREAESKVLKQQEQWMAAHRGRVNAVMVGVGAAFDYHAGTIKRAPKWMQNAGMEWLHRLCSEPRRLWKRYLMTNTIFIAKAMLQLLRC